MNAPTPRPSRTPPPSSSGTSALRIPFLRTTVLCAATLLGLAATAPAATHGIDRAPVNPVVPAPILTITGRVLDGATGRPLPGVQVTVEGTSLGTVTNAAGRYTLSLPVTLWRPGKDVTVRAVLRGYAEGGQTVDVAGAEADDIRVVDFRLQPVEARPEEIAVNSGATRADRDGTTTSLQAPGTRQAEFLAARSMAPGAVHPGWGPPPADREQYAYIDENDFRSSLDHPLSTFSIDVDRASYSNIRRFLLREGRLPPVDAVQVEEMVNYFPYRYELPRSDVPVAVTTEVGDAPWRTGHRLLRIGVASRPIATESLPPANLVFLLDVSGSMRAPDKLPLVKRSLRLLVDQMREEDRVAIAVYAGAAGLVLEPTSGAHRERILDAIDRLEAGGSTAGGAGLRLAYDVARRHFVRGGNNRVILATDGDFNVGESSDAAMRRLVEERRQEGTFLTILGFGTGNLQATKMQEMAQNGNGNYAYIDGLDEARKVLVGEMGGTLLTVAQDVKIQVEFNPDRVRAYRLIGYENRLLAAEDFNDDTKDAGELGAGHTVTALYEIVPVGAETGVRTPAVDPLRYRDVPARSPRGGAAAAGPTAAVGDPPLEEMAFVKVRYKEPGGTESRLLQHPVVDKAGAPASMDLRFASAVAGFGMLLRESEHRGEMTAGEILALARSSLGRDEDGYRHGFLELVDAYRRLAGHRETDDGEAPGPRH